MVLNLKWSWPSGLFNIHVVKFKCICQYNLDFFFTVNCIGTMSLLGWGRILLCPQPRFLNHFPGQMRYTDRTNTICTVPCTLKTYIWKNNHAALRYLGKLSQMSWSNHVGSQERSLCTNHHPRSAWCSWCCVSTPAPPFQQGCRFPSASSNSKKMFGDILCMHVFFFCFCAMSWKWLWKNSQSWWHPLW